jgi:hypothetical protein
MDLGPAIFYLDDVRDIYNALTEFSLKQESSEAEPSEASIEIRALNAIADEIGDLQDATRAELDHLTLTLSSPKIRIDLWSHDAEFVGESDNPTVRSFATAIKDYTATRRSRRSVIPRVLLRNWVAYAFLIWIAIGLLTPRKSSWHLQFNDTGIVIFAITAVVIIVGYMVFYSISVNSIKVLPSWRKEGRQVASRVRVELILAIISALIIGALGFWAGLFVHK